MTITVKLFATLRDDRFKQVQSEAPVHATVMDILHKYDIPPEQVSICLINGRDAPLQTIIENDDIVSLFPPIGGG